METYIETTLIINGILVGLCCMVSSMYFATPLSMKQTTVLSLLLVGFHMIVQDTWTFVIIGELYFAYLLHSQAKVALVGLALRTMMNLTGTLLFQGQLEGMVWYVPIDQSKLFWLLVAGYGIALYYLPKISTHWLKKHYTYSILLSIQDYQLKGKGYLDSGNIASAKGIPVIFLNRQSLDELELDQEDTVEVRIRTLHGVGCILCYRASITIAGHQEREVLVGHMDEIRVKRDCDVLLNVKLFQVR